MKTPLQPVCPVSTTSRLDSLLLFHFSSHSEALLIIKHFFSLHIEARKLQKKKFADTRLSSIYVQFEFLVATPTVAFYAGKWNRNRQQPPISKLSRFLRVFLLHSFFLPMSLIGHSSTGQLVCEASELGKGDRGRKIVNNIFYALCLMPFAINEFLFFSINNIASTHGKFRPDIAWRVEAKRVMWMLSLVRGKASAS